MDRSPHEEKEKREEVSSRRHSRLEALRLLLVSVLFFNFTLASFGGTR